MAEPENKQQEALSILTKYYTALANQMSDEILERQEEFESSEFGNQADEIIQKYSCRIQQLGAVYSILRWKAYRSKPEGKEPLDKHDFRCFGCGGVIHSNEDACTVCGWTWR